MVSKNRIALFYITFIALIANISTAFAQQVINLKDIAKVVLVKRESGESKDHYLTSGYQIIEIRPGINGWNCYQFHHTGYNYEEASIDSPKTFYKRVAAESIAQLINIIVKPDSNVNIDRFNINISELVRYTDSINTKIKPKQKAEFIKAVRTDTIIKKALNKVLHPLGFSDGLYNSITLTDNSGRSITIKANCFENRLYDLPWIGDGFKYYDPNITNFFESICGDSSYRVAEKQKLYFKIDEETYSEYFLTRFYWDDFKSEQSESFAILQNTLTPILFNIDEGRSIVNFQSALLPPYVEIHTSFKQGDTSIIRRYKRYEDTLLNVFKNDNFLFRYLRSTPEAKMIVSPGLIGSTFGKDMIIHLKQHLTGPGQLDYRRSLFITLYGGGLDSHWIWLPDNSLILLQFYGKQTNDKVEFMNFDPDLFVTHAFPTIHYPCILFDSSGKLIHNCGSEFIGHDSEFFDRIHY